jgi:release factor glutamine methyltransferase
VSAADVVPPTPAAGPTLAAVTERLTAAGCVAAADEAAELVAAAPDASTLEVWLRRREAGEPPAWITGRLLFCGRALHVDPGVYVPRGQTEELARRAAAVLPPGGSALDLCTGAGAIAAHLRASVPSAAVLGVDCHRASAVCARRNGVPVMVADLDEALGIDRSFDLVTAVAPYVPSDEIRLLPADVQRYESRVALDGGPDGLDLVRRVIDVGRRRLRPGGWLMIEVGGDQDDRLRPVLAPAFEMITCWADEDDDLRGMAARRRR